MVICTLIYTYSVTHTTAMRMSLHLSLLHGVTFYMLARPAWRLVGTLWTGETKGRQRLRHLLLVLLMLLRSLVMMMMMMLLVEMLRWMRRNLLMLTD